MTVTRRALLLGSTLGPLAAGCGDRPHQAATTRGRRFRYGGHPDQYADLRVPRDRVRGTVVLLHGGYWQAPYLAEQLEPLAGALGGLGWATWNVEYRRLDAGGGFPRTFADVAAAIDRLGQHDVPRSVRDAPMVTLGHSAGGTLAVWAASRSARTPGGSPAARLRAAVSLSGVLDLADAARDPRSGPPVRLLMGGTPGQVPRRYRLADPARLVPTCPVWAVHAAADAVVPATQGRRYAARARATGATVHLATLEGDHVSVIDPEAPSFPGIRRVLDDTLR